MSDTDSNANAERIIPEMSVPTSVCIDPSRWHAYDNMATELEVIDFLRALVIMLKPRVAIETGCYHGHATRAIAEGLHEEGRGHLYSCDLGNAEIEMTRMRLDHLARYVILAQVSGIDLITFLDDPVDFAFLDSGPDECRALELRALYPKLTPGGVVAIHDTGIQGYLREKYLGPALRELDMQAIYFDTPRGLALCRKRPVVYP